MSQKYIRYIVEWIVEEAILYINSQTYTLKGAGYGEICRKAVLERIEQVYGTEVTDKLEVIQVDFSVKSADLTSFQVLMALGSARTRFIAPGRGGAQSLLTVYNGHQVYGRIMSLTKKNQGENCIETAKKAGIPADLCICSARFPALYH
jgi:hypothetical protein